MELYDWKLILLSIISIGGCLGLLLFGVFFFFLIPLAPIFILLILPFVFLKKSNYRCRTCQFVIRKEEYEKMMKTPSE